MAHREALHGQRMQSTLTKKLISQIHGAWWRKGESAENALHIRTGVPVHLRQASLLWSADTLAGTGKRPSVVYTGAVSPKSSCPAAIAPKASAAWSE